MNRRDTLKSLLAGLFVGWWPKKKVEEITVSISGCTTDASGNLVETELNGFNWWGHAVLPLEDMPKIGQPYPTQWMTTIKSTPDLIWSDRLKSKRHSVETPHKSSDGSPLSLEYTTYIWILIVTEGEKIGRQVIGAFKDSDGQVWLQLGYTVCEINKPELLEEVEHHARQAVKDLQKLEFKIG